MKRFVRGAAMTILAMAIAPISLLAQKSPPPVTRDLDRDGVPDARDRCRGTAVGTVVDQFGCPVTGAQPTATASVSTAAPVGPVAAPNAVGVHTSSFSDRFLQGTIDGRSRAELVGTGGRLGGGFAAGFFLGLIGTGVVYAMASGDAAVLPPEEVAGLVGRDQAYVQGFEGGFADRLRGRRKSAALTGGLLGTAAIVVVLLSAQQ